MLVVGMIWIEFRLADRFPFFGDNLYSLFFFGIPLLSRLNKNRKFILLAFVAALIWNSSPFTPTIVAPDWVWFIVASIFFIASTRDYVNDVVTEIDADMPHED